MVRQLSHDEALPIQIAAEAAVVVRLGQLPMRGECLRITPVHEDYFATAVHARLLGGHLVAHRRPVMTRRAVLMPVRAREPPQHRGDGDDRSEDQQSLHDRSLAPPAIHRFERADRRDSPSLAAPPEFPMGLRHVRRGSRGVVFAASDAAKYINGSCLTIECGVSAHV